MFTIVLVIIGGIVLINFNSRISRIEQSLGSRPQMPPVPTPQPQAQTPVPQDPHQGPPPLQAMPAQPGYTAAPLPRASSEEAGGRVLGKIGIFALLIGVSFFLKYTFDNNLIGVGGRIALGIVGGLALLGLGQFLRAKYRTYSDVLMGGGIGILYLTTYAAFAFYDLISQPVALILIGLITALAVVLSVVDGAITLAVIGIVGGFLTPFLISGGEENMVSLFLYVTLLDLGVLAISFREKWLRLNYIAFVGTLFAYWGWVTQYYRPDMLPVTLFFATVYFLIFVAVTVSHHIFRSEKSNAADLALVSFNALWYYGASTMLLNPDFHDFMGFFTVLMAVLYFGLSFVSYRTNPEDRSLNFFLPALAVFFLTVAIPIQLTGEWVTLAWLIEAVLLVGIGAGLSRNGYYVFGAIVYMIGILRLTGEQVVWYMGGAEITPFFNKSFFLWLAAIAAGYTIGYIFHKAKEINDLPMLKGNLKSASVAFLVAVNIFTVYAVTTEVNRIYDIQIRDAYSDMNAEYDNAYNYGNDYEYANNDRAYENASSLRNQKNTVVSIIWALYAIALIAVGFVVRSKVFRLFGLIFFFVTAAKVFIDVWSLGELYRIISSITFGIIALVASFAYAKYKNRIKEMMYE